MLLFAGRLLERFWKKKIVNQLQDKSNAWRHVQFGGQTKEKDTFEVQMIGFRRKWDPQVLLEQKTLGRNLDCIIGFTAPKGPKIIYNMLGLETGINRQSGAREPRQMGPQKLIFAVDLKIKFHQH